MDGRAPKRLGRLEVLGAWLGLWTPPRGVEVPPVPRRKVAAIAVAVLVLVGAAAAFALPRLAEDRAAERRAQERTEARRHAAFLESVDREQAPRRGRAAPDPGEGAPEGDRAASRVALLSTAQDRIAEDARERTRRRIRGVDCDPFPRTTDDSRPESDLSRRAAAYNCVAVTARFGSESQAGGEGVIGIPFRLVVEFERGRFAWCRIVPLGDRDRLAHPLPGACRI
jgi:hypothetical protein